MTGQDYQTHYQLALDTAGVKKISCPRGVNELVVLEAMASGGLVPTGCAIIKK